MTSARLPPASKGNTGVRCYRMWARKSTDSGVTWLPDDAVLRRCTPLPTQPDPGIITRICGRLRLRFCDSQRSTSLHWTMDACASTTNPSRMPSSISRAAAAAGYTLMARTFEQRVVTSRGASCDGYGRLAATIDVLRDGVIIRDDTRRWEDDGQTRNRSPEHSLTRSVKPTQATARMKSTVKVPVIVPSGQPEVALKVTIISKGHSAISPDALCAFARIAIAFLVCPGSSPIQATHGED